MKLAVFGATGGTGQHVVEQACELGHDVVAVVRDPSRLTIEHPRLAVVRADIMDPTAIAPAIAGRDAVISAVGPRGRGPTTVCADSATAIIAAMRKNGMRRFVVVSNSGMHVDAQDGPMTRVLVKPMLARMLRHGFADMRRMEELVMASGLDYTVVRPPMLTDGKHTGRYRTGLNHNVRGGNRVSRADLADQLLRCLDDDRTVLAAVAVAK